MLGFVPSILNFLPERKYQRQRELTDQIQQGCQSPSLNTRLGGGNTRLGGAEKQRGGEISKIVQINILQKRKKEIHNHHSKHSLTTHRKDHQFSFLRKLDTFTKDEFISSHNDHNKWNLHTQR